MSVIGKYPSRMRAPAAAIRISLFLFLAPHVMTAQDGAGKHVNHARALLNAEPFEAVRDSVTRSVFTRILPASRWQRSQDMFLLGTLLGEKAPEYFLGPLLRGLYLAEVSTDRRGHSSAARELAEAWKTWPRNTLRPHGGHMDVLLSDQYARGVPFDEQLFRLNVTRYYIQLCHQLCDEYLELNAAREAYETLRRIMAEDLAYDLYSKTKLAWMHYKYRSFAFGPDYPFLKPSRTGNIREARALAASAQLRIAEYRNVKRSAERIWLDESDISWYHDAATNIISLAYGVEWKIDSSIAHYERMPEWMKVRNNGIFLHLANLDFRSAEREFEAVGYDAGEPADYVMQPSAIDAYAIVTIFKGTPEVSYHFVDDYVKKYQEGRGWGLICAGTVNYWNGHLDESLKNLATAEAYPEVFGNISLTRTNYDMVIHSQRSLTYDALANTLSFEPSSEEGLLTRLWDAIKRFVRKLLYRFLAFISRQRAADSYLQIADRSEFQKIFYLEATGDPYQLWSIMRRLDPEWHLEKARRARSEDPRKRASRYYDYLEAAFLHESGENESARAILERGPGPIWSEADTAYEKLTIAMIEDLHIRILEDLGEDPARHIAELYRRYPQAALLWGHRLPVYFDLSPTPASLTGEQRDTVDMVSNQLFRFDFQQLDTPFRGLPTIRLNPRNDNGAIAFNLRVELDGNIISEIDVPSHKRRGNRTMRLSPAEMARRLAYGVFRIHERAEAPQVAQGDGFVASSD